MIDIASNRFTSNKIKKDLRIVLLSDIHFSKYFKIDNLNLILDNIRKIKPDYICVPGDIIDEVIVLYDDKLKEIIIHFFKYLATINKVFITLGNHDIKDKNNDSIIFFNEIGKIKNIYLLNDTYYIDNNVVINGCNLPYEYYYNKKNEDDYAVMLEHLNKIKLYFSDKLYNICLVHSPNGMLNKKIRNYFKKCDLMLCGHMHNGLVFKWLDKLIKNNYGIVSPNRRLFPKLARGYKKIGNTSLVISGGITKLSNCSGKILRIFNGVYPISINVIEVVREE